MPFVRRALRSAIVSLALGFGAASAGAQTPSQQCLIKGNVSSRGERIYHPPGCRYYNSTVIDPKRGERWFCSEQEAVAAGWRRTKVC
jgi:hypothetical protein